MTLRFLGKQKVKSVCTKRDVEALTLGPVLDVQSEKKRTEARKYFLVTKRMSECLGRVVP